MRVTLIFPPQWTAAQPHLGMATLNGELRRAGHEVRLHDLNLAVVEQLLSSSSVALSLRRTLSAAELLPLELVLRRNAELGGLDAAAEKLGVIERWLAGGAEQVRELSAQVEGAREDLRRGATYYSPASYVAAHGILDRAIELYSLPYYPSRLLWNGLLHPHVPLNPDAVIAGSNIWAGGWAEGRAKAYGVTVEELPAYYAKRTLLSEIILPEDIANAVFALVGGLLSKSTGNALNVDGGVAMGFLR